MEYIPKHHYEQYAKELAVGESGYYPHKDCTTNNKMWVYRNPSGSGCFCNKCGRKGFFKSGLRHLSEFKAVKATAEEELVSEVKLPEDYNQNIGQWHPDARLWLYKADIRNYQIAKYSIGYSKKLHRVIIPVYAEDGTLLMWQGRGLNSTQTKYYNVKGFGKNEIFFKSWVTKDKVHKHNLERVVVVEDALSVIKVGRTCQAVASLGTSMSMIQYNYLSSFRDVVMWYDDDAGGLKGSEKAIKKLAMLTNVSRIRTKEDPKKLSYDQIREELL